VNQDILPRLRSALADRYRIERELGSGGMATVHLARDLKHSRQVAIKVLRPELAAALGPERFLREIEIAARLQHPHILTLIDSGEAEGLLYYVMPFVEGETLRQHLDREHLLPLDEACRIADEVAEALQYAHSEGIIHRDIKPENIMLSRGHAVVTDFGIARALSEAGGTGLTQTGFTAGTPAYMSPEQASADQELDARSDIYALGCVLYEMLAGEPPFTGHSAQAVLTKHMLDPVPRVSRLRDTVPPTLDSAVTKAIAKAPADRFTTAGEFAEAMRKGARVPTWRPRVLSSLPAERRALVAAALVVVIAVAAVVLQRARPTPGPAVSSTRIAVLPFKVRGSAELAYLGGGIVELLSRALDGAGELRTVDPHAVLSTVTADQSAEIGPTQAAEAAQRFGAGRYVLGSVVLAGGSLEITASVYEVAGGEPLVARAEAADDQQILEVIDDLARQIVAELAGGADLRLSRLAANTTQSFPALKAYLDGERAYHDFDTDIELGTWAAEKALELSDRLSERERRLLEAFRALERNDGREAERIYRSIIATYPDELQAWYWLGETLFHFNFRHGRRITEARFAFERAAFLSPRLIEPLIHFAQVAAAQGRRTEADSLAELLLSLEPAPFAALPMRAFRALLNQDTVALAQVEDELRFADDATRFQTAWTPAVGVVDLDGVERLNRFFAEQPRSREDEAGARSRLSHIVLARGRRIASRDEVARVRTLEYPTGLANHALLATLPYGPERAGLLQVLRDELESWDAEMEPRDMSYWILPSHSEYPPVRLYLLGLLNAQLSDGGAALRYAEQLEEITSSRLGSLPQDLALGVRAEVARLADNAAEALGYLERTQGHVSSFAAYASPFAGQPRERFLRARLLDELDRDDEALAWYASLGDGAAYDFAYLGPALLGQADIYDARGASNRALEYYRRFVSWWSDCDTEFRPMVERARLRIEELTAAP
jgi:TolB-like protein